MRKQVIILFSTLCANEAYYLQDIKQMFVVTLAISGFGNKLEEAGHGTSD